MRIPTRRLAARALDCAIELALINDMPQPERGMAIHRLGYGAEPMPYSTSGYADDVIDREKIETRWIVTDSSGGGHWMAQNVLTDTYGCSGVTRREAAMRCFVASKLGDVVDVPEALA